MEKKLLLVELSDHSSKWRHDNPHLSWGFISFMENEWWMSKEISVLEETILYLDFHTNLYITHLQITRGAYFISHITGGPIPLALSQCHLHLGPIVF
jgi:hypothetical protein